VPFFERKNVLMASETTTLPNPSAAGPSPSAANDATSSSAATPSSTSLPDPFVPDPFQASASPTSTSLPDPFASDPFQPSTDPGTPSASSMDTLPSLPDPSTSAPSPTSPSSGAAPASGSTSAPQTGVWLHNSDPQYLIQWSLQEIQQPPSSSPAASQAEPPATYTARVRIFQEVFETALAATRPMVPFSLRDANTGALCLQGSLVLLQQPSDPPVLLVKNLRFSGFQRAQVVLFPSAPNPLGGASGG
jgi:hypothetical protein